MAGRRLLTIIESEGPCHSPTSVNTKSKKDESNERRNNASKPYGVCPRPRETHIWAKGGLADMGADEDEVGDLLEVLHYLNNEDGPRQPAILTIRDRVGPARDNLSN